MHCFEVFLFKIGGFVEISPRIFKAYPMAHSGFHILLVAESMFYVLKI